MSGYEGRSHPQRGNNRGRPQNYSRGGGTYRGNGPNHQQRQPPAPQTYGIDPEDLRDMPAAQRNGNNSSASTASSGYQVGRSNYRGRWNNRGRTRQPNHNRPPLQIAGNPDRPDTRPQQHNYIQQNGQMEDGEMNAHLSERILAPRRPEPRPNRKDFFESAIHRNPLVEHFERAQPLEVDGIETRWRKLPEVPTAAELLATDGESVPIPTNIVKSPWESVDDYLGTHYELLREDCFAPLRDAVGRYKAEPTMDDEKDICVYEKCQVVGTTFTHNLGICVKMNFSTNRARKKILWKHSKRLCPGTLVAMSTDNFNEVVKIATVAARPLDGVDYARPPLRVDLLMEAGEIEIDPTKTWIMIESRSSYFEAYKHVLKALQRMDLGFPLHKILTLQDTTIKAPQYIQNNPNLDLTACFNDQSDNWLQNVNVHDGFPRKRDITTSMDQSQLDAVERIMTKELAIVQGPPGCGKTFVSVKALAVMIANKKHNDPPIIVACQTNHALDQLLRHVLEFEPNIIRLGGRTQDRDKLYKKTLYNVRQASPNFDVQGGRFLESKRKLRRLNLTAERLMKLLKEGHMTPDALLKYDIITQAQRDSFQNFADQWAKPPSAPAGPLNNPMDEDQFSAGSFIDPIYEWVRQYMVPVLRETESNFEYEEDEIAYEALNDREEEFDDEWDGKLNGVQVHVSRCKEIAIGKFASMEVEKLIDKEIKKDDVWKIPEHLRPHVYARWERNFMATIEKEMRVLNVEYAAAVSDHKIAKWEKDAVLLGRAKVVGMTTTGVSKYRSLVAALRPKICLIEEAAETLEGPLIAACYPSIQQLILVGDHKQLKGHCSVQKLEGSPYYLATSMFERLVDNGVEYTMLNRQRRMRPEIRKILAPIYPDLDDDDQVMNKPSIPGMQSNIYFCAHQIPEEQDEMSKKNKHEAQMTVNLCGYLVENGIQQSEITILTFYTGQVREIARLLRQHKKLNDGKDRVRLATVDSFQGEESEVVILSLCRSNAQGSIGFLSVSNRVCVALSRAKRGFYMFGNAALLSDVNELWWDVLQIMNNRIPSGVGMSLPLVCARHKQVIHMNDASDWYEINGGCKNLCGSYLECGHRCPLKCHPYDHIGIKCVEDCMKQLKCGHRCLRQCHEECVCDTCKKRIESNAHMEKLSEQLSEVRTTDLMPATLYPNNARRRTAAEPDARLNNPVPAAPARRATREEPPANDYPPWDAPLPPPASQPQRKSQKENVKEEPLLLDLDDFEPATQASSAIPDNGLIRDMHKYLLPINKSEGSASTSSSQREENRLMDLLQ
ncbi:hypothetical protein TWF694_008194 [Orbilia ellipsospora]|uniref:P-loop containing nucleoside triphosphate hydrolase protein n=1 Tax=Orbilia ellipsospora TaxID=2528407 RepID=A0AAV9XFC2_9PEZI